MEIGKERLERLVDHGLKGEVSSPMDPPQAYDFQRPMEIPFAEFSKALQVLIKEHETFLGIIDGFEQGILKFKSSGYEMTEEMSKVFGRFFRMMDEEMLSHHAKEEKGLFPLLRRHLIRIGECSPGEPPRTAVEVMEGDHLRVMQTASLVFNLIGLAFKLKDQESRETVLHHAVEQAIEMIEGLRLHIFKENHVLFPQAEKLLSQEELRSYG